jgi:signal recognition particle subunit SRP19
LKTPSKIIVWPANLDSTKSRIAGRKVPKASAIQAPRLEEINEAAKRLSFDVEITEGKSRPSSWWEKGGYAIITRKGTKSSSLRALTAEIKRARAAKIEK